MTVHRSAQTHGPAALLSVVQDYILANHPYECPCIAALPVTTGNPAYLQWIAACTLTP